MVDIQHHFLAIQDIRTHFVTAGSSGSPVVLLHGGGVDCVGLSWTPLIPVLAENHQVIALDWPGYGESDRPPLRYSQAFYVQFLSAFLTAVKLQQASLVGISMGGGVAIGFSLQWPERVDKLVLVDSYGLQKTAPFHQMSYLYVHTPGLNDLSWALMRSRGMARWTLQALLRRPGSVTEELVDQTYREIHRPNAQRAWTSYQKDEMAWHGTRTCYMDRLGAIQAPTLIVHGSKDTAVPAGCAREAHQRIQGSVLHWMEGCGHWPQRDNPEEFNRVVQAFLADQPA